MITKQGLYLDMSPLEYHADPAPSPSLNQSIIPALIDRSPMHAAYQHPRLNPYGDALESTMAQHMGEAVHRLTLGRGREISTIRHKNYRDAGARAARDLAIANKRIPILEAELVRALDMAEILKTAIADVLEGAPYATEVAMFWKEETPFGVIWCRQLLDVWCQARATALDLKVLRGVATPGGFGATSASFGYDIQEAMAIRGLSKVRAKVAGQIHFADLVIENYEPYAVAPLAADAESLATAESDVKVAISRFAECLATGKWPSYPRKIQAYSTPPYRQRRSLERAYNTNEE